MDGGGLKRYLLKRIGVSILLLFLILTATFFILRLAPGDPTRLYLDPSVSAEDQAHLKTALGLDKPLVAQYGQWVFQMLQGNLGVSFYYHRGVLALLAETLPKTLLLSAAALTLDYTFGILIGIFAATRRSKILRGAYHFTSLFLYSLPTFWLGLILILVFSYQFKILPPSHMADIGMEGNVWNVLKHLILPALTLAIPGAAATSRFMFKSYEEVLKQPYILTHELYNIPRRQILFKYALKNALLPVITLFGLSLPFLVSGALITEVIFSWPGMGRLTYNAILTRDYPLIIGASLLSSFMVLAGNLVADLLYGIADPRIRHGG
jgi:peptide/nickel transport system permease protein